MSQAPSAACLANCRGLGRGLTAVLGLAPVSVCPVSPSMLDETGYFPSYRPAWTTARERETSRPNVILDGAGEDVVWESRHWATLVIVLASYLETRTGIVGLWQGWTMNAARSHGGRADSSAAVNAVNAIYASACRSMARQARRQRALRGYSPFFRVTGSCSTANQGNLKRDNRSQCKAQGSQHRLGDSVRVTIRNEAHDLF